MCVHVCVYRYINEGRHVLKSHKCMCVRTGKGLGVENRLSCQFGTAVSSNEHPHSCISVSSVLH